MRIVAWNIRAGGGGRSPGIFQRLLAWQPGIIALSEFRGTPASQQLAAQLRDAGWAHQLQSIDPKRMAVNALALFSKYPLEPIKIRHAPQQPRRWLPAKVGCDPPFVICNIHIPNAHTGFKYPYHAAMLKMMKNWRRGAALFIGDSNSGKAYIDDVTGIFWKREHQWMEEIERLKWTDAFRHLHGDKRVYSWYSHRDNGYRLDQAFLNRQMMPALQAMRYEWGSDPVQPSKRDGLSDHAAIILDLMLERLI